MICDKCKKVFEAEVPDSYMRGEDITAVLCPECSDHVFSFIFPSTEFSENDSVEETLLKLISHIDHQIAVAKVLKSRFEHELFVVEAAKLI